MSTRIFTIEYVARYTNHPAEDLARNWSANIEGVNDPALSICDTLEQAAKNWEKVYGDLDGFDESEWRFHPAFNCLAQVDYEGLGAYSLTAQTLEEAFMEVECRFSNDPYEMVMCSGAGTGYFSADNCIGYHATNDESVWIFEIRRY
jgi:hypothetical protein